MRQAIAAAHEYSVFLDRSRDTPGAALQASLVTQGCIDKAKGISAGGAVYNFCNWNAIGIANLADSLCAVRTLAFEERCLTLQHLADVLAADWDGHEPLRQKALNALPHFGNDDDTVDAIAADIVKAAAAIFREHTPYRGGQYTLGTLAGYENAHIDFGHKTGATLDGRRGGEPFASSLCAAPGRDRRGVTAMLNSVAKIPHHLLPTSTTVNVMLDRRLPTGQAGVEKVASLIAGHFRSGGQQFQFTFVDREILLAARKQPDRHANLMVRVAGYSAPFIALPANVQDEVLQRVVHGL